MPTPFHAQENAKHIEASAQRLGAETLFIQSIPTLCDTVLREKFFDAVGAGSLPCIEAILKSRPDILNAQEKSTENTACHIASLLNHTECLRFLLEEGADPTITTRRATLLHTAASSGNNECVDIILAHLHQCVQQRIATDQQRLDYINQPDGSGHTALFISTQQRYFCCVQSTISLLKHGANLEGIPADVREQTFFKQLMLNAQIVSFSRALHHVSKNPTVHYPAHSPIHEEIIAFDRGRLNKI